MESNKAKCEEKTAKKREKRYYITTIQLKNYCFVYRKKKKQRQLARKKAKSDGEIRVCVCVCMHRYTTLNRDRKRRHAPCILPVQLMSLVGNKASFAQNHFERPENCSNSF